MAFQTTAQSVNDVVRQLCDQYQIYPGVARLGLRELGYQVPTTCGRARFNWQQAMSLWGDFDRWIGERECARGSK